MISALTKGGRDRAVIRIVARAGIDPPEGWERFDARFDQIRADVVQVLKANLPGVRAPELIFRTRCAAGMLNWLALAPVGDELSDKSEKQAERLLVPIVAGCVSRHELGLSAAGQRPSISSNRLTRGCAADNLKQSLELYDRTAEPARRT